ncbi:hypothetical protein CRG98_047398 [Punica granatum]|uniref:Uncharacterized protein n=1 Tax=Punica granatum TaxID=22663 RepID=A0A2I0HL61_PUNGR|nr:hypothetical protein CRG98_047398 [Punica granatum]
MHLLERTPSYPPESNSPPLFESPSRNSLSPVMIPPPRHLFDNPTAYLTPAVPVPKSSFKHAEPRRGGDEDGGAEKGEGVVSDRERLMIGRRMEKNLRTKAVEGFDFRAKAINGAHSRRTVISLNLKLSSEKVK